MTVNAFRHLFLLCKSSIVRVTRHKRALSTARFDRKSTREVSSTKKDFRYFVDHRRVKVKAGDGGDGCMSFLRLFAKEFAGPDGGDGGNGGHIIFQADNNIRSLNHLKGLYFGENGVKGANKDCHGKNALHTIINVPLGTLVKDAGSNHLYADLDTPEAYFVAARGGAGGKGNHFFLSNEERAPMVAEKGGQAEEKVYNVELRLMADIGLIGFPNAGKSSLLRALSRAKPKVASYPFTTLRPYVGVIEYEDHAQISVADIPGLIKGAHLNYGLGISFLRHIERCSCLLYVLDLSVDEPWTQLKDLKYELNQYSPGLSDRPHAVIANKIDLPGTEERLSELRSNIDLPVYSISAKKLRNIGELTRYIRALYNQHNNTGNKIS